MTGLLERYLAVEEQFAGKVLDEAMVGLVKANKVRHYGSGLSCEARATIEVRLRAGFVVSGAV